MLIEPYIAGKELSVGVMDGKAMTVTEIIPRTGFYDYEAKYAEGGSTHIVPAPIPDHAFEKAMELSEAAHGATLELPRGCGRTCVNDDIAAFLVLGQGQYPTRYDPHLARSGAGGPAGRGL